MKREYYSKAVFGTLALAVLLFLSVTFSGCIYLIVGGVGAVGGYIVSPDTVEGLTDHDQTEVWNAASEIISIMGLVVNQIEENGTIDAKISGAEVHISIVPVNEATVKLEVKARKLFLPRISIAQDVFVKIMNELEPGG